MPAGERAPTTMSASTASRPVPARTAVRIESTTPATIVVSSTPITALPSVAKARNRLVRQVRTNDAATRRDALNISAIPRPVEDASVDDVDDPVGRRGHCRIVRDEQRGGAAITHLGD